MGKGIISLLIALGAGAWIYNKFMRTTGSLVQRSLMAATVSGVVIFLIAYIVLGKLGF